MFTGQTVLITGGTGSFGRAFVRRALELGPRKLIVYSRDECKQAEMAAEFPADCMRYFIGDVRDKERLWRAFDGVSVIIHAAALKQVPACEYNPFEAVRTNVLGAQNVIEAAIDRGVRHVIALSTDKAANPVNLYGATKLCSDKLFIHANAYVGTRSTRFSVVRYGNVIGSRGSVIPLWRKQAVEAGCLTLTDWRMTRFWLTLEQGVQFVMECLERQRGGEIFVPKIPSMRLRDLAQAIAPGYRFAEIGIRPGEKLHELLITEDDARHTLDMGGYYTIVPEQDWWRGNLAGQPLPEGFRYASDTNTEWLTVEDLRGLAG